MNSAIPVSRQPKLSVVLATDGYSAVRGVISCLRRQSAQSELEVVLVAARGGLSDVDETDLVGFGAVQRVEIPPFENLAVARAAGVRAATAPIVFIGETHSYAQPGWAEALIKAHEGPWAGVMPQIGNADTKGAVSWGGYLLDYGRWGVGRPAGEMSDPLTYNTSFKRHVLLDFGDRLEEALDPYGGILWPTIFGRGLKAWFEPAAQMRHLGPTFLHPSIREKTLIGLIIGSYRARSWSVGRRLAYFLGGPLVPFVLVSRSFAAYRRIDRLEHVPFGSLAVMFLECVAKAAAEMFAIVAGAPASTWSKETEMEIHRLRYCRVAAV